MADEKKHEKVNERSPLNPRCSSTSTSCSSISQTNMENESNEHNERVRQTPSIMLYLSAASALLGAVGMGAVLGWTSPAFDTMKQNSSVVYIGPEDKDEQSWIGSSMTLGAFFGAFASGPIAQYFGRRKALILYGIPFTLGWLTLAFSNSVTMLIVGRVICGISAGLLSGTAPSYIVEISVIEVRGFLGACFQLCVTIGILLVFVFGAFTSWNVLAAIASVPTFLMAIFMIFMPETPSWLLSVGRKNEAVKSLSRLRGPNSENGSELFLMEEEFKKSKEAESYSIGAYLSIEHGLPLVLSLGLMFYQQFSGINAVMFYSTNIFSEAGSTLEPKYCTIIIGVAQVVATVAGSLLVDRLGRRLLLRISAALHVIALSALGAFYYYVEVNKSIGPFGQVPVISLVVFIIGFSIGYGPIPWLMIAEITPMHSRSLTSAFATGFNWSCAFMITKFFESLKDVFTKHGTFFLFAFLSLLSFFFVTLLPETKGKSPEEIKQFFSFDSLSDRISKRMNKETPVEMERVKLQTEQ